MTLTLVHLLREGLVLTLWLVAPLLLTCLVTGLLTALLQHTAALHDPILAALPRLVVGTLACVLLAPWALRQLLAFTAQVYACIGQVGP